MADRIGLKVPVHVGPDELWPWIASYVAERNAAPTAAEIRAAANFYQPGGIARLCEALEVVGRALLESRKPKP